MRKLLAALTLAATLVVSNLATAGEIYLGTATGKVAVNYNTTGGENPGNQAFFHAVNNTNPSNGATFNFDPNLLGSTGYGAGTHFYQVLPDQFGFDLNLVAPTWDGSSPSGSQIATYDYDNTNPGNGLSDRDFAGNFNWAISGYISNVGGVGPAAANSGIINSLFRGNGVALSFSNVQQNGTIFTVDIEGELTTDGFVHWYTPGTPDLALAGLDMTPFGYAGQVLTDRIGFRGTYTYNSANDTTRGIDFYEGSARFFHITEDAEPVVPEPATLSLIGLGLTSGAAFLRRRRKA